MMNPPYLIEPYNPWARGPRKKTLSEQIEEEEMFARMLAEQQAIQRQQQNLSIPNTTPSPSSQQVQESTAAGAAGAGGHNDYDLLHSQGDNNMTLFGHGTPVGSTTPQSLDQLYIDQDVPNYWISTGLTNTDWLEIEAWGSASPPAFPDIPVDNFVATNTGGIIKLEIHCQIDPGNSTLLFTSAPVSSDTNQLPPLDLLEICPTPMAASVDITDAYTNFYDAPPDVGSKIFIVISVTADGWQSPQRTIFSAIVPAA